jgi:hypothetical protein
VTLADLAHAQLNDDDLKNLCKKNIVNAFDDVPLSNVEHGLMGCVPAEMLHVSGIGVLKYIFVSLCDLIGSEKTKRMKGSSLMICIIFWCKLHNVRVNVYINECLCEIG